MGCAFVQVDGDLQGDVSRSLVVKSRAYVLLTVAHTLPKPLKFCPPVEFEAERGVRVVVAYIEDTPERAREDFTMLALEARGRANSAGLGFAGLVFAFPQSRRWLLFEP